MNIFQVTRPLTFLLFAAAYTRQSFAISEANPVTYTGVTKGCWVKEEYEANWCDYPSSSSGGKDDGDDCRQIITENPKNPQDSCMRLTLPAEIIGGSDGGMTSSLDIKTGPSTTKECINENRVSWSTAWFQYDVMFADNFYWGKGGKLPGLTTYPDSPTGCIDNDEFDGDSVRYMWRENGELKLYLYDPEKVEECGDYYDMSPRLFLTKGQWYTLTQEVHLNDLGKPNGYVNIWVDGVKTLNLPNLVLHVEGDISENQLKMDCFRGGSSSDWASPQNDYVFFDNFKVSQTSLLESSAPTKRPTVKPSSWPTISPSNGPTITFYPTGNPTDNPSRIPTITSQPSFYHRPTSKPTRPRFTPKPTHSPNKAEDPQIMLIASIVGGCVGTVILMMCAYQCFNARNTEKTEDTTPLISQPNDEERPTRCCM